MAGARPADFVASLDSFLETVDRRADLVVRAIAEAVLDKVKEYTPVDTGFLRAGWSVVPGGTELPVVQRGAQPPPEGASPLTVDLSRLKAGAVVRIVNPVAYARPVEFGHARVLKDGSTRHVEGRHMAARAVAELPALAERVVRDVASR